MSTVSEEDEEETKQPVNHKDWKTLLPFRCIPRDKRGELPIENVGLFSFLFYSWLDGFMWRAFRGRVNRLSLWSCPEIDSAQTNADKLEQLWRDELRKSGHKDASLPRVFIRFVKRRWLVASLTLVISIALLFISVAFIMQRILHLATVEDAELWQGLVLVLALFATSVLSQILFMGSVTVASVAAGRLRAGILCFLFRKLVKSWSFHDKTIGKVVNLFSNDSLRVFEGAAMGHMILSGPLLVIGSTAYAIYLLGPWALIGLGVLLLLLPLQMTAGKFLMKFRHQAIILTDSRVRMMTEHLANIRFIKMYSWEKALIKLVEGARSAEQRILEKANIALSLLFMTAGVLVSTATMCTLIAFTMSGNHLSSAQGFMYLLIYTCIQDKLELCMMSLKLISEFSVAAKRFQEALLLEDNDDDTNTNAPTDGYQLRRDTTRAFELTDAVFRWPLTPGSGKGETTTAGEAGEAAEAEDEEKGVKETSSKPSANLAKRKFRGKAKQPANDLELEKPLVVKEESQIFGKFNLTIDKGQVVAVIGPVSSGKTSLITALLGQMRMIEGRVVVGGCVAYVPQQPWIFNASVRDNILFGLPFDENRYGSIVSLCCLTEDLSMLVSGDMTEIGERGVTISGGQKQRISLARALYSNRDIYLLDDPFASLDPDVAEDIFSKVILGHLVGKTVLLVTHQSKFFSKCGLIIRMRDRQMISVGCHEELLRDSEYLALVSGPPTTATTTTVGGQGQSRDSLRSQQSPVERSRVSETAKKHFPHEGADDSAADESENCQSPLMKEEETGRGAISVGTYIAYVRAAGGLPVVLVVVAVSVLAEASRAFSFWWLAHWLEEGAGTYVIYDNTTNTTLSSDNISDNPLLWMYNLVYGMSLIAILIFFTLRSVTVAKVLMRASSRLHEKLFGKMMRSPIKFFDTTPLGRLINRFSRDMDEMDSKLPLLIENTLKSFLNILIYMGLIAAIMPWFLVAIPLTMILFLLLYVVFRAGVRELQRLQLIAMSPLLSHVEATVRGLSSIQAYKKRKDFEQRFQTLLDHNTVTVLLSQLAGRWVGIRLSLITTTLVSSAALLIFLLRQEIPAAYCGAAIVYAFQLLTLFQLFVHFAVNTGATFASTERIHSYTRELKEEGPFVTKTFGLPKDWPSNGQIQFTSLNLRHRQELPLALNGITFQVKPQEKIGIVGRTGSGKSSLVEALFRLTEADGGRIEIGDIDISLIGLEDLRTKLSIIPQDPVLFSGTVRSNLDPFQRHIDQELWNALEKCHIKDTVRQMDGQLLAKIVENGGNLSQGERQLLSMTRVLLRHTKIMILDEATASLDHEMEEKIQRTINETFSDCTILIIAHRLRTVLDCDRILVLDEGKVVEYDEPASLLANPDSRLSHLVNVSSAGGSTDSPTTKDKGDLVWV